MAPREPWRSPEAPRLQVSEGPVWAPAVSEGGGAPESRGWLTARGCGQLRGCTAKDPWNPRKNRASVGQGPILGHAHCTPGFSGADHCSFCIPLRPSPVSLTSLPASPRELHLLRGTGSPACPCLSLPTGGASSCPAAHGGCQQPWNRQQKLISKEHLTPRWDRRVPAPAATCSPPSFQCYRVVCQRRPPACRGTGRPQPQCAAWRLCSLCTECPPPPRPREPRPAPSRMHSLKPRRQGRPLQALNTAPPGHVFPAASG